MACFMEKMYNEKMQDKEAFGMETKFVRLDHKNSPVASAVSEEHRT